MNYSRAVSISHYGHGRTATNAHGISGNFTVSGERSPWVYTESYAFIPSHRQANCWAGWCLWLHVPGGFYSRQPGPHTVARNGCFGIGWKAGPAGLQTRVPVGLLQSADAIAVLFTGVVVFRSCKFLRDFRRIQIVLCCKRTADELCDILAPTVNGERWASRGEIVRETRCCRISWVCLVVLSLHVVCLASSRSKIPELACQYLYRVRFAIVFWFTCVKSKVQRLIARNRR